MGIAKNLFYRFLARSIGRKVFTSNPCLGFILDADESDVIAD